MCVDQDGDQGHAQLVQVGTVFHWNANFGWIAVGISNDEVFRDVGVSDNDFCEWNGLSNSTIRANGRLMILKSKLRHDRPTNLSLHTDERHHVEATEEGPSQQAQNSASFHFPALGSRYVLLSTTIK